MILQCSIIPLNLEAGLQNSLLAKGSTQASEGWRKAYTYSSDNQPPFHIGE